MSIKDGTIKKGEVSLQDRILAWWEGYDISAFLIKKEQAILEENEESNKEAPKEEVAKEEEQKDVGVDLGGETITETLDRHGKPLWNSTRIGVAEKIWGEDYVLPYEKEFIESYVRPLGIKRGMTILDLTAGLGILARDIARSSRAWVIGLEESPSLVKVAQKRSALAKMGKSVSIKAYNAENMKLTRKFNYVFARHKLCGVKNKEVFIKSLAKGIKTGGQLIMLDYVASEEVQKQLQGWCEKEPVPPKLVSSKEMEGYLKDANMIAMPAEDLTRKYHRCIVEHVKAFKDHIENVNPDIETSASIMKELDLWVSRVDAIAKGLTVCLFVGVKK